MRVYIVSTADILDDPYEGWNLRNLDSVWSTIDKARERINYLKEKRVQKLSHPEECANCYNPCGSGHDCFYSCIDDADPNHIRLHEIESVRTEFFIQERRLDIVDDEAK